jgi:predicted ester cyclase
VNVNAEETRKFALRLMDAVWRPFDFTKLPEFYHADVIGHHRGQTIRIADIENRLRRDRIHWSDPIYDIKNLIADEDAFALRFLYSATQLSSGKRDEVEVFYFYRLTDGRINEFWTLASIDFDYFEKK